MAIVITTFSEFNRPTVHWKSPPPALSYKTGSWQKPRFTTADGNPYDSGINRRIEPAWFWYRRISVVVTRLDKLRTTETSYRPDWHDVHRTDIRWNAWEPWNSCLYSVRPDRPVQSVQPVQYLVTPVNVIIVQAVDNRVLSIPNA